jgi:hypothetical protein
MPVTRQRVKGFYANYTPAGALVQDLPAGFLEFFVPLHHKVRGTALRAGASGACST